MTGRVLTRWGAACATSLALLGLSPTGPAEARLPVAAAAVAPGGVPWTWGGNGFGQLGDGTTQPRLAPGPVVGLSDVVDLHGGREHVVALRGDGTVWAWGSSQQGQLGLGGTTNRPTPTQVPGLSGATAVETGHNSSLALLADGTVRTWGLNTDGQLGDGTTTQRRTPVSVVGPRRRRRHRGRPQHELRPARGRHPARVGSQRRGTARRRDDGAADDPRPGRLAHGRGRYRRGAGPRARGAQRRDGVGVGVQRLRTGRRRHRDRPHLAGPGHERGPRGDRGRAPLLRPAGRRHRRRLGPQLPGQPRRRHHHCRGPDRSASATSRRSPRSVRVATPGWPCSPTVG